MLPAFATIEDLAARMPGGLASADEERAQAALDDASTKIRVEGLPWVDANGDVIAALPDIVFVVCLAAALRSVSNPDGLESQSIGIYGERRSNSSTDVYLTANERRLIRQAAGVGAGLWTQPTTRGNLETPGRTRCGAVDTVYVDTVGGSPIPYTGTDGY